MYKESHRYIQGMPKHDTDHFFLRMNEQIGRIDSRITMRIDEEVTVQYHNLSNEISCVRILIPKQNPAIK